jgi:hypothetical protein
VNAQSQWETLEKILPQAIREQLAALLLERIGEGFGKVTVEIKDHSIKMLFIEQSYLAVKPGNN